MLRRKFSVDVYQLISKNYLWGMWLQNFYLPFFTFLYRQEHFTMSIYYFYYKGENTEWFFSFSLVFWKKKRKIPHRAALFHGWVLGQDLDSAAQQWTGPHSAGAWLTFSAWLEFTCIWHGSAGHPPEISKKGPLPLCVWYWPLFSFLYSQRAKNATSYGIKLYAALSLLAVWPPVSYLTSPGYLP